MNSPKTFTIVMKNGARFAANNIITHEHMFEPKEGIVQAVSFVCGNQLLTWRAVEVESINVF